MSAAQELRFYADAGHGWLRVPLADLDASGFTPTQFSYHDHAFAYLEEDRDAPDYLLAAGLLGRAGELHPGVTVREIYDGPDSPIRRLARFEVAA